GSKESPPRERSSGNLSSRDQKRPHSRPQLRTENTALTEYTVLPDPLRRVIHLLSRLPGVGEKTAQRFALKLMVDPELSQALGAELSTLTEHIRPCARCGNLAEVEDGQAICEICADRRRDGHLLCVV